jgi:hypothetical protein
VLMAIPCNHHSVSYLMEEGAAMPAGQFNLRVTGEASLTNMADHICLPGYHDSVGI